MSVENLHYLSSEQALADLAHFRTVVGQEMKLDKNKWISFGGSYPGISPQFKYRQIIEWMITNHPWLNELDCLNAKFFFANKSQLF